MRTLAIALLASCLAVPVAGAQRPVIVAEPSGVRSKGRHGQFSKKYLAGPHCRTVVATYFGTAGAEEFVAAAGLPDGGIVAFGNAWGPDFPTEPKPVVLGRGRHSGRPGMITDRKGRPVPDAVSSDRAGMLVFYAADGGSVVRVLRFAWGVASISTGRARREGLVVAGRCGPNFASFAAEALVCQVIPHREAAGTKKRKKRRRKGPAADVYLAALDTAGRIEWLVVLEKNGDPPEAIFTDEHGRLWFDADGLHRVAADGGNVELFNRRSGGGTTRWLAVHPDGESAYFGGDRNTHTGAQPYRQPFLYKFGPGDDKLYTLWEPKPRAVGSKGDGSNLMSDSSPRAMTVLPDGTLFVTGWSDGGNTVFARQALDHNRPVPSMGMGMSAWGMKNANSLAHMMMIDDATQETLAYTAFLSYIPSWFASTKHRGAPNFINIQAVQLTAAGLPVLCGRSATGLIQTPGCYWLDPMNGDKYGGSYVAVLRPDLTNALFASYLPGYQHAAIATRGDDVVVVGRSQGVDRPGPDAKPPVTPTPVVDAPQADFGGAVDAHLILLETPDL